MNIISTFYLLEPRWMGLDNFYKIFITSDSIYGGKIASQFFNEESLEDFTIHSAGNSASQQVFAEIIKNTLLRKKHVKEKNYDMLVLDNNNFLKTDRNNFIIEYADILKVIWKKRRSLWTARHNNLGTLTFQLNNKKTRKFIISDQPGLDENIAIFGKFVPLEIM